MPARKFDRRSCVLSDDLRLSKGDGRGGKRVFNYSDRVGHFLLCVLWNKYYKYQTSPSIFPKLSYVCAGVFPHA